VPNLGLVRVGEYRSFTVADIPGLIEGAHLGKGLGHQFLRHVERTSVLLFMIDAQSEDPANDLKVLRNELGSYDKAMLKKEWLVVITRGDTLTPEERTALERSRFVKKHAARCISAVTHDGVDSLIETLWTYVERFRAENLA